MLKSVFAFNLLVVYTVKSVEFCTWEIFQPRCSNNEIIVIEQAYFGRKTMGRCLTAEGVTNDNNLEDNKFLGCFADVKRIFQNECAGKTQCDVTVAKIEVETHCHKWLKFHLEIQYFCLQVVRDSRHCAVNLATEKQFISSYQLTKNGCGSKSQPFKIESLIGQRIIVSIFHSMDSSNSQESRIQILSTSSEHYGSCHLLGKILDKQNKKEAAICLLSENSISFKDREFISESNNIEVVLTNNKNLSLEYILGFEATGCSDLIPPADAWLKRTENEATIGCYSTRLRWQLKCVGQRWTGASLALPHGHLNNESAREKLASENSMVPIVAIAMTGFVICFLIICIGVVFINRYYAISKSRALKQMANLDIPREEYNNESLAVYDTDKPFLTRNLKTIEHNGIHLNAPDGQEPAHYFELDQSYMGNGHVPSKV